MVSKELPVEPVKIDYTILKNLKNVFGSLTVLSTVKIFNHTKCKQLSKARRLEE